MKIIENKETKLGGDKEVVKYADLIKVIVNNPTQGGLSVEEMRNRIRILDAIDHINNNQISLEDTDANKLKELVEKFTGWATISSEIIDFADAIKNL